MNNSAISWGGVVERKIREIAALDFAFFRASFLLHTSPNKLVK